MVSSPGSRCIHTLSHIVTYLKAMALMGCARQEEENDKRVAL